MKRSPLKRKTPLKPSKRPLERKPMQRGQPKRLWFDAIRKVQREGRCRVCGAARGLEAAHTIGRGRQDHDAFLLNMPGAEPHQLYVNPNSIVPLCGSTPEREGCHYRYDTHGLDLLPHLSLDEQLDAVRAAGGIEAARKRLTGGSR